MRILVESGKAGVNRIISGSISETLADKTTIDSLKTIDKIIISNKNVSPLGIDLENNALELGGFVVFFDSVEYMEPYLAQARYVEGAEFNPGITGLKGIPGDPLTPFGNSSTIIKHTYTNTDIESEWLKLVR